MRIFVNFIKLIKKSVENLNKIFFKVSKTVSKVSIVKIPGNQSVEYIFKVQKLLVKV